MAKRPLTTHARAAKLARQMLKEAFPGTKFSVRSDSYAGGSSINIHWTNGPTEAQVKKFSTLLEGKYFDGMIDYAGYNYLTLDGEDFSSVSYVFENRHYSDEWIEEALAQVAETYGVPKFTAAEFNSGSLWNVPIGGVQGWDAHWNVKTATYKLLQERSEYETPEPSPTAARFGSRGDDGHGRGTVGNEANGWQGEGCYRAQAEARERYLATQS